MKKIILFCIPLFLCMCSPKYNVEFKEYKKKGSENLKRKLLKAYDAEDDKYSLLVFTKGFKSENTLVINQNDTLYQGKMKSDDSMGLAKTIRVNNSAGVKIIIENQVLKLKKNNVANHKFIYLGKNAHYDEYLYTLIYSNSARDFY